MWGWDELLWSTLSELARYIRFARWLRRRRENEWW
jgi:hypothetical protein